MVRIRFLLKVSKCSSQLLKFILHRPGGTSRGQNQPAGGVSASAVLLSDGSAETKQCNAFILTQVQR